MVSPASAGRSRSVAHEDAASAPDPPVATRPVMGMPKAGLRIAIQERPQQRIFHGLASPALLYLVVGTALGLGALGKVTLSPERGSINSLAFSVLFSPVILFVVYGALRLRSSCVVDRQRGRIRVRERSYFSRFEADFALDTAIEVRLAVRPETPIVGTPARYGVYLRLPGGFYQVLAANTEDDAEREADKLAIFMELPVRQDAPPESEDGFEERGPVPWGAWFATVLVYAAPIAVAVAAVYMIFRDVSLPERLMITSLSAIILSQIGAILAFAYNRSRGGT